MVVKRAKVGAVFSGDIIMMSANGPFSSQPPGDIQSGKNNLEAYTLPFPRPDESIQLFKMFGGEIRMVDYERSSLALTIQAMSYAGVQGREKATAKKTFSHHALPTANKFRHPYKILTGCETELHLNVMKKLQRVATDDIEAGAGRFDEIAHIALVKA